MLLENKTLVAVDTETHLIRPGNLTPRLVCGTFYDGEDAQLLLRDQAIRVFCELLERSDVVVGGANILYDLGVLVHERPDMMPVVFQALEDGRVVDTHILEVLHDIALGTAYRDGPKEFSRYSLLLLERRYLGIDRSDAKHGENAWRLRYSELDGLPLEQWPEEAKKYPLDDAVNTFRILEKQLRPVTLLEQDHFFYSPSNKNCEYCGKPEGTPDPCAAIVVKRHNIQCLREEMKAAWWLHLSAIEGMRTDPLMVPVVIADWQKQHAESRREFFKSGIVRVRPCNKKEGAYESADDIPLDWLAAARGLVPGWEPARLADISACEKALSAGRPIRFAEDRGRLKQLVDQAYNGSAPVTPSGSTSTARDTLTESGSELLESYGEAGPTEKELTTYASVLEQGTTTPINPEISFVKVTQRVSYRKPNLTNLPRAGRTRECFVPSGPSLYYPGQEKSWVMCSTDYAGIELVTLAQCCLWLFGKSSMADAINADQDLHTRLASRFMCIPYEEGLARKKAGDKLSVAMRQTAKPVNFGKPGLMGPPKMVFTARKDGVRFCELAGRGTCREHPKVTQYARRQIQPTCRECLDLAIVYSDLWYEEFPEMRSYHEVTVSLAQQCADGEPLQSFGTGLLRLERSANACSNHLFQNLAAQGVKRAGSVLSREIYTDKKSVLYGNAVIKGFVHDEILTDLRETHATECAYRISEILRSEMQRVCPDVKVKIEPALMRRWFKGAEKVVSKSGKLVPWWPKDWTWPADRAAAQADAIEAAL